MHGRLVAGGDRIHWLVAAILVTLGVTQSPAMGQSAQVLTRVFYLDEARQSVLWSDLLASEKPTLGPVREIAGFPNLDPATQSVSGIEAAAGKLIVGVRSKSGTDTAAGWILIDCGVYEEAHGDHSHWIYPHAPRVRAAVMDGQASGPTWLVARENVFYWTNAGQPGFHRLDPAQVGPREPAATVRQRAAWHQGGGEQANVATVGNVVAFAAWKAATGEGGGRVDVTALRPTGNDKVVFSFDLPNSGVHTAIANHGKVFFASPQGLNWITVPKRISSDTAEVSVESIGENEATPLLDQPLAPVTHGRYVAFTSGHGADSSFCFIDAAAPNPRLARIPLPSSANDRPGAAEVIRNRRGQPLAFVFHAAGEGMPEQFASREVAAHSDRLSVLELDPDRNGDWSDARLAQTIPVGRGMDGEPGLGHHISFEADNRRAVYTNPGEGTLMVLSVEERKTVSGFKVGGRPTQVIAVGGRVSNH